MNENELGEIIKAAIAPIIATIDEGMIRVQALAAERDRYRAALIRMVAVVDEEAHMPATVDKILEMNGLGRQALQGGDGNGG